MSSQHKHIRIMLAGGGSGGPVAPLLSIVDVLRRKHGHEAYHFCLVGTKRGPEGAMASQAKVQFKYLPEAKLTRYPSVRLVLLPFLLAYAFIRSLFLIGWYRPHLVFGAGGFVQVPLMYAAWLFRIPVVIHQQDVRLTLSNYLCSFIAKKITVTFEASMKDFPDSFFLSGLKKATKTIHTGNPTRLTLAKMSRPEALAHFGLQSDLPVLLVLGGGTGAQGINTLIKDALPQLTPFIQVLHSTGAGKGKALHDLASDRYKPFEFISNMSAAYASADVVLARAGLSTLAELSLLSKVSIIVPMPNSHQLDNAFYVLAQKAAVVAEEDMLTADHLATLLRKLLFDRDLLQKLGSRMHALLPHNAADTVAEVLVSVIHERT